MEKLDINADLQHSGRIIYNCIKKLYALIGTFADDVTSIPSEGLQNKKPNDVSFDLKTMNFILIANCIFQSFMGHLSLDFPATSSATRLFTSFSHESNHTSLDRTAEGSVIREYRLILPEYELLDFIIHSNFTMKLQEYYGLYGVVPMRDIYKGIYL